MAKHRKPPYRSQFDGHRRLAAAVIIQAVKDSSAPSDEDRETALEFLQGDMRPFSEVLDLPDNHGSWKAKTRTRGPDDVITVPEG